VNFSIGHRQTYAGLDWTAAVINVPLIVLMATAIRSSILAPLVAAAAPLSVSVSAGRHVKSVPVRFARCSM